MTMGVSREEFDDLVVSVRPFNQDLLSKFQEQPYVIAPMYLELATIILRRILDKEEWLIVPVIMEEHFDLVEAEYTFPEGEVEIPLIVLKHQYEAGMRRIDQWTSSEAKKRGINLNQMIVVAYGLAGEYYIKERDRKVPADTLKQTVRQFCVFTYQSLD